MVVEEILVYGIKHVVELMNEGKTDEPIECLKMLNKIKANFTYDEELLKSLLYDKHVSSLDQDKIYNFLDNKYTSVILPAHKFIQYYGDRKCSHCENDEDTYLVDGEL